MEPKKKRCENLIYSREETIKVKLKTSIQSKEVVFYREVVVSDNQMALLQANDTEDSFAGVGLSSNAPSNVQEEVLM